ncbi:CFL1 Probable ferric reductase transmembrane component [Candida maltosa Xu316]
MSLYQAGYDGYYLNLDNSLYYGSAILGYWLLIMLISAVGNWSKVMFPGMVKKMTSGPVNIWRKYISMPATFHKKKTEHQSFLKFFGFMIPSRYETIVIFLFYVLTIIVNAINMGYVEGNPVKRVKTRALLEKVGDRTGIIATIMTPLVFLFAGRNNFLQWLTGCSYATFITYHRHIARVMFCLVVIHAATYTKLLNFYADEMKLTYMIWGTIATIAGGIMLVQGMLYFRRNSYEIFLLIHIIMASLYVAGTWIHVDELGYVWFVYPAVAVWGLDRLVRIGRLISFGFPKAKVSLLDNDTIRVVIPKPKYWYAVPGGHAFIHFLKPTYFWQSHPFTYVDSPDQSHIVVYCKVKGGITHSLYKMLTKAPGQTTTIRVGVEGPYGESTAAKYADSAVFIAGGNGIPGIYSEIFDIARHVSSETNKSLRLIWVTRDEKSVEWFADELEALKGSCIQTTIYITRPTISNDSDKVEKVDSGSSGSSSSSIKSRLAHVEFKNGRPDMSQIVVNEIRDSPGSVGFVTCGHPVMVDEVRYYACQNINNPENKRVDLYEQLQVWS